MAGHTPEPWHISEYANGYKGWIEDAQNELVAHAPPPKSLAERYANAERIVACVNACKGINPEAVPDLLAAAEEAARVLCGGAAHDLLAAEIAKAKGG